MLKVSVLGLVLVGCAQDAREPRDPRGNLAEKVNLTGRAVLTSVKVGGSHACALSSDQTLWCWGDNSAGQSSDSLEPIIPRPTRIGGLDGVRDFSLGQRHSCAIVGDNRVVMCWGSNTYYQVGDGIAAKGHLSVVAGLGGVEQVALGGDCSCALSAGKAVCWGTCALNWKASPKQRSLQLAQGVVALTNNGNSQCGIAVDGTVWCWGLDSTVNTPDLLPPKRISGIHDARQLGGFCSVSVPGEVFCWGNNDHGQLGNGAKSPDFQYAQFVAGVGSATDVATGYCSACAVDGVGLIYCWGCGLFGTLGHGPQYTLDVLQPQQVPEIGDAESVVSAVDFACTLLRNHAIYCWGNNAMRQLGGFEAPNGDETWPWPVKVRW